MKYDLVLRSFLKKILLFNFILCLYAADYSYAQAILYPGPTGLKPSTEYQVKVNGKNAFVYDSPVPAAYCSFDMKGAVDISIKVNRDVKWVDVRPVSSGINPFFKDSTISLHLEKPSQLSIEVNGTIILPLFLFANAPETNRPNKNDKKVMYFEAGKIYYPGIIKLTNNQSIYIEGGAVVVGVIKAFKSRHLKVYGRGIIDGSYNSYFNDSIIKSGKIDTSLRTKYVYHQFFEFVDCEDVVIDGITLHNSTSWEIVPTHCNRFNINNIKIVSDQPSDDGIDILHSKNVTIENSFIRTRDDCISIKSYIDYTKNDGVDSVLVQNCVFWNGEWGNCLEIGYELFSGETKNIIFRNCDIIHVEDGAAISIHNAGSSNVKNILYENIRIEDSSQKLFDFAIFKSRYRSAEKYMYRPENLQYLNGAWDGVLSIPADKKDFYAQFRGTISNVTLRNIQVNGRFPFSIFYGFDNAHKVSNVVTENLTINGKKIINLADAKFYIEKADNIIIK